MDAENDLIQCPKCKNHIFSAVFGVHEMMCKPVKKKQGFFSKLFQEQKQEQEAMIPCPQCGDSVPFSMYALHQQDCVGHQLTKCSKCRIKFPTFLFEEHVQVCEGHFGQQEDEQENDLNQVEMDLFENMIQAVAAKKLDSEKGLTKEEVKKLKAVILMKDDDCPICCTTMRKKQRIVQLPCQHHYHSMCIQAWLGKNPLCPMCRTHALSGG